MKKLYLFSGDEKYIEKCKKFFNYFEINIIDKKSYNGKRRYRNFKYII